MPSSRRHIADCHTPAALPGKRARGWRLAMLGMSALALTATSAATGVIAGTKIQNTVVVSYVQNGTTTTHTASNTVVVDQLIDVVATWQNGTPVQAPDGTVDVALLFRLTNTGNGPDSYKLALTALAGSGTEFTADNCKLYLDSDNNGSYSDADALYTPGSNDPSVVPDAHADMLAVCDIPQAARDGALAKARLLVISNTLTGQPGTEKAPSGTSVLSYVVGRSGGKATTDGTYQSSSVNYAFNGNLQVTDRSGGAVSTSGSTVLYTLNVIPNGDSGTGRNLVVTDPIPDHTQYVPGSLTLDNVPLGDSDQDGDVGDFNISTADAITVKLGDVVGTAKPHVISFKVTIN